MWRSKFGEVEGKPVDLFLLKNQRGMEVTITNYGGCIVSLKVPDRNGKIDDIVLGFDSLQGYVNTHLYFGSIVGRYANRIGKAKFILGGKEYKLTANRGEDSLHGGAQGFDKKVWDVDEKASLPSKRLVFTCLSQDGEEGYPGNVRVRLSYTIADFQELQIHYEASTDKPTVLNLTSHSYFNLAGAGNGDILSHELKIEADRYMPINESLIPTGELSFVNNTPFDFRTATAIGTRINERCKQLENGKGYDHNWVLNNWKKAALTPVPAAEVFEKTTGRCMNVLTTEPGIQFYSGNFLDGTNIGKGGHVYKHRSGFCLETQHFPDSPNKPDFPTTVLYPGEKFESTTLYSFSVY